MDAALRVDVGAGFFGVRCPWEHDVGVLSARVAVVALVDDVGGFGDGRSGEFVGAK